MAGGESHGDQYLTAGEVAEILQVSPKTVSRWADKGLIRCVVTLGGHRRFQRTLVEKIREEMYGPAPEITNGGDAE
ncbi:MAG: helix-turn-helix domain-containing protein [Actinomycetota bacterium]|nr:helix-turn-helix domain-containing protein [Actinomycetota bacterium]